MIHNLFVGHFEREKDAMNMEVMKLEKRKSDGLPRPLVARPLDMARVDELLMKKGVTRTSIPEDWWLGIEQEGFITCDPHTRSRDAINFIRELALLTGCDIMYDGVLFVPPEELTYSWDQLD